MRRLFVMLLFAGGTLSPLASDAAPPYAGLEKRPITAFSADEIAELRAGRGMGLALPAELNGYPGPRHVLELARDLDLSPEQRRRTEALFEDMQRQAVMLGERVIASEQALDRLFAEARASEDEVLSAALRSGELRARLRAHHLRYHVVMRELLRPEQIDRYRLLRGYATSEHAGHGQAEHGGDAHGGGGHGHAQGNGFAAGHPGEPAEVDRTIRVEARDIDFSEEQIEVRAGETIRFVIENTGELIHDFTIGTAQTQAAHREAMAEMMAHHHDSAAALTAHGHDDANAAMLAPGETRELIWTFEEAQDVEFACNVPGHYEAGMHGDIVIRTGDR